MLIFTKDSKCNEWKWYSWSGVTAGKLITELIANSENNLPQTLCVYTYWQLAQRKLYKCIIFNLLMAVARTAALFINLWFLLNECEQSVMSAVRFCTTGLIKIYLTWSSQVSIENYMRWDIKWITNKDTVPVLPYVLMVLHLVQMQFKIWLSMYKQEDLQ